MKKIFYFIYKSTGYNQLKFYKMLYYKSSNNIKKLVKKTPSVFTKSVQSIPLLIGMSCFIRKFITTCYTMCIFNYIIFRTISSSKYFKHWLIF